MTPEDASYLAAAYDFRGRIDRIPLKRAVASSQGGPSYLYILRFAGPRSALESLERIVGVTPSRIEEPKSDKHRSHTLRFIAQATVWKVLAHIQHHIVDPEKHAEAQDALDMLTRKYGWEMP